VNIWRKLVTVLLVIAGVTAAVIGGLLLRYKLATKRNRSKLTRVVQQMPVNGRTFRDLNKNGRLDPYEDPDRPIDERVEDLLQQMTLEEKAGLMVQPMINAGKKGELTEFPSFICPLSTSEMVINRQIKHFSIVYPAAPQVIAAWHNSLQKMAERTRLGIPVTISSDPRHTFADNPGAGIFMEDFSHWPEPLGLAASRDEILVQQFGDIARQEYLAVGIRTALHPMADLATEPRWARISGTFGEDADLARRLTAAYIRGFQGESLGAESVSCMVKHFPGGGPQKDGWDAHFSYGREQVYPGNNFDYHLIPFEGAFEAGVEQVMPYYGIPMGQTSEDVGMNFNKEIITDLLRKRYGFDGVICTDWSIIESNKALSLLKVMESPSWGVENLSVKERYLKAIAAGVDQFGGQFSPHNIVELVRDGKIAERRIDESVRRILRLKFKLGLFDNPYVDDRRANEIVGTAEFRQAGEMAQRRSVVLLKNGDVDQEPALPLDGRYNIYIKNIDPEIAGRYGRLTDSLETADFALLRLETPYEKPRSKAFFEKFFHQGDLDFKGEEKARILKIMETKPTIVDIHLERAAVIPEIAANCLALFATFGVTDEVFLDAVFGNFNPDGKLPLEMPSSMEAVRNQKEDLPSDSESPLFSYGYGLRYM
jgi:beta-glucosidase